MNVNTSNAADWAVIEMNSLRMGELNTNTLQILSFWGRGTQSTTSFEL